MSKIRRYHADGDHSVEALVFQSADIHAAQRRVAVGMGVHAAHTAQTAAAPAALNGRQLHALVVAYGYRQNLAAPANVDAHLAVNKIRHIGHTRCQLRCQQLAAF